MIADARKNEIQDLVSTIDRFSERYQLSHATVAIEKLYKEKIQKECQERYAELREQVKATTDPTILKELSLTAKEIQKDSKKRIHISIEYIDQIETNSSRIALSQQNMCIISLPKSKLNIRQDDGTVDKIAYHELRKLMAHELGHVVLHCGIFNNSPVLKTNISKSEEAEADFFAEELLSLRDKYGEEFIKN